MELGGKKTCQTSLSSWVIIMIPDGFPSWKHKAGNELSKQTSLLLFALRVFAAVGDRELKAVIELSTRLHSVLLGIAMGIALEKELAGFF